MPQTTGVTTYSLETESSLTIPKLRRRGRQKIRIRDKEEAEKIGEGICSWYPLGNSEHIFLKEQLFMAFVSISPIIALTPWYPREQSPFCCGSCKLWWLAWEHGFLHSIVSIGKCIMNWVGIPCIFANVLLSWPHVIDKIMTFQRYSCPNPWDLWICYLTWGKRILKMWLRLRNLRCGDYPGLFK